MTESQPSAAPLAGSRHGSDSELLIDALRARGAERFDPVGWRFIEALARRRAAHGAGAGGVLDQRLTKALGDYRERFDRAEREAADGLARGKAKFPEAADVLTQHYEAGDFGRLHRLLAKLEARGGPGALAELLAHIERQAPQGELKSLRYFRGTWTRLKVDRRLSQASAQAPENAGPLNSHFLVLQSLRLMRDISPEYLEQFMSYVDALLWLEQADSGRSPVRKDAARGEPGKKRKSGRGKAG